MAGNINGIAPQKGQKTHGPADPKAKARLEKAVRDFEAIVLGYMLKSMRNTIPKDDMMGEGFGGDMMEGMFDSELARHLSHSSNLGLAEMLYRGMTGEAMPRTPVPQAAPKGPAPAATKADPPAPPTTVPVAPRRSASRPAHGAARRIVSGTKADTVVHRVNGYAPLIEQSAQKHGVDANLLKAVIASESAGDSTARSSKDAKGLMQLIDSTATAMGVRNVWDPGENIEGGAKYLGQMLERFDGNIEHAVASFNAGPGAVEKHGGVPPIKETRDYVARVMNYLNIFAHQEGETDDEN